MAKVLNANIVKNLHGYSKDGLHFEIDEKLAIYYGAADCYTCLAFTTVDILMDYMKGHDS